MLKDREARKIADKVRKERQRMSHPKNVTPDVTPCVPIAERGNPMTPLGKTVESMMPSERDIWERHGIDIRTEVYCRLLSKQLEKR